MAAAQPIDGLAFEDLTTRARIRDAALRLFAERGIDGATVRDIAKEAGVSAGLIRHHFGSKEALRDACDAYAFDQLMRIKEQAVLDGQLSNPGFLSTVQPTVLSMYRYLARALLDGSQSAADRFDETVKLTEQWLSEHPGWPDGDPDSPQNPSRHTDSRAYAAVICAMQIGMLGMHEHLSRALGADMLSPEGHLRLVRGMVDLHAHAMLSPEQAAQAYAALDQAQQRRSPTTAESSGSTS
jgi:AcrR family transcriptional regulator